MFDQLIRELDRPRQKAAPVAVWRRSTVTAVQASPPRVQTALTGEAWLCKPRWWTPVVGDEVELIQQGTDIAVWTVFG